MSDITRPVKKLLPQYLDIEERLQKAICEEFNISDVSPDMIKEIDDALLYYEFIHLLGEKVFDDEPELIGQPDFTQRDFINVKNEFINIYIQLTSDVQIFKIVGIDGCDGGIDRMPVTKHPLFAKYSDDVVDAVCLALIGRFAVEGKSATIPNEDEIKTDSTGLKMQMIIPKL